ncbi:MAG: wax ester/triacylglycerol synthase family O-acyltransferase [Burkholderiales bacterium]
MADRERMSAVDTAWLRMDRPHNLMVIRGVMAFDRPLDLRRLRRTLEVRFARYPRLHQIPVDDVTGAYWLTDPEFSIDRHLTRVSLPGEADAAELKRLVSKLAPKPFDHSKPWWDYHYVDNYQGGAALISRIHHCYADGVALIGVLLSMTDERSDAPAPKAARKPRRGLEEEGAATLGRLLDPLGDLLAGVKKLSGSVFDGSMELLRDPAHVVDYAKVAARVANDAAALALMPDDSHTRFKGQPGIAKQVAWTDAIALDEVKAVGKALDCSVNDVLLSCVAGALRDYLVAKGDDASGVETRAMVPVNLRAPGSEGKLGNRFGLVPLVLPVGIANPLKRVYEVHNRMEALKGSYTPVLALGLLGFMGIAPNALREEILSMLANKSTAVMTNVPGPQKPLYLAGRRIDQIMFWVPQSGNIGMGVSILSYNGGVQFAVITDKKLVPDPDRLIAGFRPEFEKLLLTVLMEPWDAKRDPGLVERELARAASRWLNRTGAAADTGRGKSRQRTAAGGARGKAEAIAGTPSVAEAVAIITNTAGTDTEPVLAD